MPPRSKHTKRLKTDKRGRVVPKPKPKVYLSDFLKERGLLEEYVEYVNKRLKRDSRGTTKEQIQGCPTNRLLTDIILWLAFRDPEKIEKAHYEWGEMGETHDLIADYVIEKDNDSQFFKFSFPLTHTFPY